MVVTEILRLVLVLTMVTWGMIVLVAAVKDQAPLIFQSFLVSTTGSHVQRLSASSSSLPTSIKFFVKQPTMCGYKFPERRARYQEFGCLEYENSHNGECQLSFTHICDCRLYLKKQA